ncbi:peptidoglycan synthase FtsI domain protein [Mycobacterium xenopi 3993]|nr:peptidoglycan synthase FtsI domain protein [Mycobacterium xenopi 3993]
MGGVTVHDAWNHGVMRYTTTGVFGKSSNVGTLMLAQRVGRNAITTCSRSSGWASAPAWACPGKRGPGASDRPMVGQHVL